MSTKEKRHKRIVNNPANVSFGDAVAWLKSHGFKLVRTKGGHHVFAHPSWDGILILQPQKGFAKPYQIKQALKALKEIGNE